MKVVLAEKPSVGKEIARVLKCNKPINGGFIGNDYIVTWALGHLVTLAMPEEINKEWANWNETTLPMIPKYFKTKVIKEVAKQFNNVKSIMTRNDVSGLIIATDAGREGELVARLIMEKVGFNKPCQRLWISSLTDKAIIEGFKKLQPSSMYDNLYYAASARQKADWLVGLNVSRALTVKYNASLSAGRVQTPTLNLIVEQERKINNFKPVPYYTISLNIGKSIFYLTNNGVKIQYNTLEEANKTLDKIFKTSFYVKNVKSSECSELPPLLYDLTSLQQDANKLYAFTSKHTLDIVQRLYETHKYLTYPRTDSKHLTVDLFNGIKERINNATYGEYKKYVNVVNTTQMSKRIFDNSKVTDHHALIPTELKPIISNLSDDEKKIYDLVLKRFISAFIPSYKYNKVKMEIGNDLYTFTSSGKSVISLGWKELYANTLNEEENSLPILKVKEQVKPSNITVNHQLTTPPDRFTEASLLYAMEHAKNYTTDVKEKQALTESSGIGTPATRADIIERIFDAGYVKLVGKQIHPTVKGMQLIDLVPPMLKSVSLSAIQELNLEKIKQGTLKEHQFIKDIINFTNESTKMVLDDQKKYIHDNQTTSKCPQCGKKLLDVTNKFGKSLVCMDKACGYKKKLYTLTKLRCPKCHKCLKKFKSNEVNYLECNCGYKAKEESFFKSIKDNSSGMSKRELNNYLKKQDEEIFVNNPFKDLLK